VTADPVYCARHPLVPADSVHAWTTALEPPVAVTGGTGFVGSHLVDTLCAAGVPVRALVRRGRTPRWIAGAGVRWVEGDLSDRGSLERLVDGAGTVFHLAGRLRANRREEFDVGNRVGTETLVDVTRNVGEATLVHVSSQAAVGPAPDAAGLRPDAAAAPVSDYGRSKLGAERAVQALGVDRRWTIVRPPAIFGPRDTDVFEFFRLADRGLVPVPGGERWLTVAWVGDVVRGLLASACGRERIVHLGSPEPRRLDDLVRDVGRAGGRHPRVVAVPGAVVRLAGVMGALARALGGARVPMTRDKAVELLARHWTLETADSLAALGLDSQADLSGALRTTWSWYRTVGWL